MKLAIQAWWDEILYQGIDPSLTYSKDTAAADHFTQVAKMTDEE